MGQFLVPVSGKVKQMQTMGELMSESGSHKASIEERGRVEERKAQSKKPIQKTRLHADKVKVGIVIGVDLFLVSSRDQLVRVESL